MSNTPIKITLEYEDKIESLSGAEAKRWWDKVNGMALFMDNRDMNPFNPYDFVWDPVSKDSIRLQAPFTDWEGREIYSGDKVRKTEKTSFDLGDLEGKEITDTTEYEVKYGQYDYALDSECPIETHFGFYARLITPQGDMILPIGYLFNGRIEII